MKKTHSHDSALNQYLGNKVVKLCIIGAGRAGEFHVNSLSSNKHFKLLYIIDFDSKKAQELANKACCSYNNSLDWVLLNVEFDAVLICTTTNTHCELITKCLNHKKHVLCEKPLGKNIQDIKDCYALAKSHKLKLLIGYQKRFDKNYSKLHEIMQENKYTPTNIRIVNGDFPLPSPEYLKTSNGIVEDMMCHDIDIINLYMNFETPEKVVTFTHTNNEMLKSANEIENIEILLQYKTGAIINFSGTRNSNNGYDQRVEMQGDFGILKVNNEIDNTLIAYNNIGAHTAANNYSFADRYKEAYSNELEYFYKMLTENCALPIKEEHLILTKTICIAINESIKTKAIVYLSKNLRSFDESNVNSKQYQFYREMHKNQTFDFAKQMREKYSNLSKLNNVKMSISNALQQLDNFVDPSDPDLIDEANLIHAYQTAERIRKTHPLNTDLQITGLIHDLGKILFAFNEPEWAIVGDTYVLGCKFPESIVYFDTLKENPEFPRYNMGHDIESQTQMTNNLGIYEEKCGLDNLVLSFGHDEYLYQVLQQNSTHNLPKQYMDIIRYHSFYPWHSSNSYRYFMNEQDYLTLENVNNFNKFDLYSKEDTDIVISDEIKQYYDELLREYFPHDLQW